MCHLRDSLSRNNDSEKLTYEVAIKMEINYSNEVFV